MRSLIAMTSGMSCSITRRLADSSSRRRRSRGPNASLSRWAMPAVGSSRQSSRASAAIRQASSTMRRVPVESSLMKRSPNGPRPRKAEDLVGLGPDGPVQPAGLREPEADAEQAGVAAGLEGGGHRLPHGEVAEELGALERAAQPQPRPAGGPPSR